MHEAVERVRGQMPQGESLSECKECNTAIPKARQQALPGVRLCVACQSEHDQQQRQTSGYNRRGSKDSQLR